MDVTVLVKLANNTGYPVSVNYTVATTAADSNKQDDVELVGFGLAGSNIFVVDGSICCDHIGNSQVNNGHLNGKIQTNDYLQVCVQVKIH